MVTTGCGEDGVNLVNVSGRLGDYLESGVSLWDVAAGGLIIECAGGKFWTQPTPGKCKVWMLASNGLLPRKLKLPK